MLIGRDPQPLDQATILNQVMLLADLARVDAYRRAVAEIVSPGDVVAEIQCGSGLLGRLALEAGAKKVIGLDRRPGAVQLAQMATGAILPRADVQYLVADPPEAILSEKVDVVLTEMTGFFGTTELMAEDLGAFAKGNLREGGIVCPSRIDVIGALGRWARGPTLIQSSDDKEAAQKWTDLGPLYFVESDWDNLELLGPSQVLFAMDPMTGAGQPDTWEISTAGANAGADALIIWFRAELAPGITLDIGPDGPATMYSSAVVAIPARWQPGAEGTPPALQFELARTPSPGRITVKPGGGAPNIEV